MPSPSLATPLGRDDRVAEANRAGCVHLRPHAEGAVVVPAQSLVDVEVAVALADNDCELLVRALVMLQRAYNNMNAGDGDMTRGDKEAALRDYSAAEQLVPDSPDSIEMTYWHAVALVNMGRVDEALPLFRKVFATEKNWAILTPRLPQSGLLPNDPKIIQRIVQQAK